MSDKVNPGIKVDVPFRSEGMTQEQWREKMELYQYMQVETRRRSIHLEPTYYGLPDLQFGRGYYPGKFDRSKMVLSRKKLPYQETEEQWKARQNKALVKFVTGRLYVQKDEKLIRVILIEEMETLLCDLFYGRVNKVILWANRGGGKSLLAAILIWLSLVYHKRSFINMGGAGNQAKRVYDYTVQFWANVPGLQGGMLAQDPLMEKTLLKNGTRLICATSQSSAIGEHLPGYVADEASILPGTLLSLEAGYKPIEEIEKGELVWGREGKLQETLNTHSHPYNGRVFKLRPYGSGVPCWITEEHRVWAIPDVEFEQKGKKGRKYPRTDDIEGRAPEWVRAWDLKVGDVLCYPRFKQEPVQFALMIDDQRMVSGPDFWRFLGYWAGDGSASNTRPKRGRNYPVKLHIGQDKAFFLHDAASLLERFSTGSVKVRQWPSRGKCIDIRSSSDKALWTVLRNQVGTHEDRGIPQEWIQAASDEELIQFLIGYLRTDGNAQFQRNGVLASWNLTTTAPALAQNVLYALNRLGLPFHVNVRESYRYGTRNRDRWDIKIPPAAVRRILPAEDLDGIEFPTKETSSKIWYDEDWCYAVIKEIEEDWYEGEVYDLEMDGDPSFGTPACTMLHNCTDRVGGDNALLRTMQGCLTEDDPLIFLLSTFHLPVGFFADMWDNADKHGLKRYKWNCILPETWMFTDKGLKQARDVRAGDQVLSEDGRFHAVTKAWSQISDQDEVTLYPYGWTDGISVTADHRMLVRRDGEDVWVEAGELEKLDLLVFPRPQQTEWPEQAAPPLPMTPELCRFLGYFLGDGWLDKRDKVIGASFGEPEKYLADYVRLVDSVFGRKVHVDKEEPNQRGRFGHVEMADWLGSWFYSEKNWGQNPSGKGGRRKIVPVGFVLSLSDECLREFVVGLMATDGCFSLQRGRTVPNAAFGQVSSSITQAFFLACVRLGLHPSLDRRTQTTTEIEGRSVSGSDWWMARFGGLGTEQLMSWMGMSPPERKKYNREQWSLDDDRFLTPIRKIARGPRNGTVYDFAVEDVHSFTMPWGTAHNCFNTMKQCTAGLEEATEEDPQALSFCMNKCPLTWVEPERDDRGEVVAYAPAGCRGRARTARGWIDREKVLEAQRINIGTRIFPVEHACMRPRHDGTIFDPAVIDRCIVQSFPLILDRPLTVGIDWGLTEAAMVLIGEWRDLDPEDPKLFIEGVGVLAVRYLHGEGVGQVAAQILEWLHAFGDPERQRRDGTGIKCRADANSPYPNRELRVNYRYRVKGVKGDRKNVGKDNVARWLASGHFRILAGNSIFVDQMKNLRRDMATGKQIKDNKKGEEGDHGPDACRFAMMDYDFIRWLKKQGMLEVDRVEDPPPRNPARREAQRGRPLPTAGQRGNSRAGAWRGRGLDSMLGM